MIDPCQFAGRYCAGAILLSGLSGDLEPSIQNATNPFDSTEAAKRQAETAKTIGTDIAWKIPLPDAKGSTLNFRLIPAGCMTAGICRTPRHPAAEPLGSVFSMFPN
jgi:hypothetical protein